MKIEKENFFLYDLIFKREEKNKKEFKNNFLILKNKNIRVEELAKIIEKKTSDIINFFWNKDKIITKNELISFELIEEYCQHLNIKVKLQEKENFSEIIDKYILNFNKEKNIEKIDKIPVVGIMGHVDHGKTTLFDNIVKSEIRKKENGGITQKITISQIKFKNKKIIFMDTPGHKDFIMMRKNGISLLDIVILIIDSSDGLMEQTMEIIDYISEYFLPTIIFINDKKEKKNKEKIIWQLQKRGIIGVDNGGETLIISGDAKKKEDNDKILESILLISNFKSINNEPGNGIVIDSYYHSGKKIYLTEIFVKGGEIKEKDWIFINGNFFNIKIISNIFDKKITNSYSGDLIKIFGINFPIKIGDKLLVINNQKEREMIENNFYFASNENFSRVQVSEEKKNINVVLLANSQNSLESLNYLIDKKNKKDSNFYFSIVYKNVCSLNNYIITRAELTKSWIFSFGKEFNFNVSKELNNKKISYFSSSIIYKIEDKINEITNKKEEKYEEKEEILGTSVVIETFFFSKYGTIAGCKVESGKMIRKNPIKVLRNNKIIFIGNIKSLEINKEKKNEVHSGYECGIVLKNFDDIIKKDKIVSFMIIKKNEN